MPECERMSEAEDLDDVAWLRLLCRFSSVQTLFVSDTIAGFISQALEYVDEEMIAEVLPALELFCLVGGDDDDDDNDEEEEDRPMSSVHEFITLRRDYYRPVTFVETKDGFEERRKSYA